jgi:hypothetical protein
VFASTVGSGPQGGYGVANETVAGALRAAQERSQAGQSVGTGACSPG